jgi:hypothetical protein
MMDWHDVCLELVQGGAGFFHFFCSGQGDQPAGRHLVSFIMAIIAVRLQRE